MATPETICGYQPETLWWALARQEPKPNAKTPVYGAPSGGWRLYEIVTTDNVKLAEIITELVCLLGYKVGDLSHNFADIMVWWYSECDNPPLSQGVAIGINMQAEWADDRICNNLTMPEARVMALCLLDLVEAEAERENGRVELFVGVERRVGGQFELLIRGLERAKEIGAGA